ncbi:penicillin-binding protein [Sphingobacterium psychroaquaticum]|uniref:Cell division protein FtsI (Penicillin-binding protein 3) n=1 Tax=Sphingobacterium psychroaquaticum TaxID=561061 RepID=A0A1X7J050_9SPHI|nr:penicillin-binding protein [Sphingobacterium psychroaquaticum]SMG20856.1 cell division protein FtsI (penicillin-binding protein 3) [Sphingobacterium psychroaquaticum]
MNIRKSILMRVYLAFGLMVFGALLVFGKLLHLQYVDGGEWRAMVDSLTIRERVIEAARGNIYSNDGSLLATSVPEYELRFDAMSIPEEANDVFNSKVDSLAVSLASFFKDKSARQYLAMLKGARQKKQRYTLIKRDVNHQELKELKKFPLFKVFKEGKKRYSSSLVAIRENKRILPFTNLAARTIGYKNTKGDTVRVGLEGAYGSYIDGRSGSQIMQRIAGGFWVPVNREVEVAPVDGSDIISTLDVNMQDMAQRALEKQLIASDADNGCVILMEVKTGEVRAIANFTRDSEGVFREKYNYAIAQGADPGSTFKLASYLALLDDKYVDLSSSVDIGNGTYKVPAHTIKDSHAPKKSVLTVLEAFEESSNVAIAKLVNTHYGSQPAKYTSKLHQFGLAQPLGLQIPGEVNPWVKTPESKTWSKLSLVQMAYGYELRLTPLQTLSLYNAVANDGKMIAPLFVKEIRHLGNTVQKFEARVVNKQIASSEAISKAKKMLEGVMTEGTGKRLSSPLYSSAGKTGTAQMNDGARGYGQRRYQSSFAGYFPAENPKYSIIVVIRNPRKGYYGGAIAGPVFKELADMVYANDMTLHGTLAARKVNTAGTKVPTTLSGSKEASTKVYNALGFTPTNLNSLLQRRDTSDKPVPFIETQIKEGVVPNVMGMGLTDAIFTMENAGFKTRVSGKGRVVNQSLLAGMNLKVGTPINLVLN